MQDDPKAVTIYTDGGAEPNPGPGGYGVVLIYGNRRKELYGGFRLTTNNRMEFLAAIVGLESLTQTCKVQLYSDSKYLVDAMTQGWVDRWKTKGWRRGKQEILNSDLWVKLAALCERHKVEFRWVKGHAGNLENERCDKLSMQFLGKVGLPVDEGYELRPQGEKRPQTQHLRPQGSVFVKINREGQLCRKCSIPVIKRTPRRRFKTKQTYYYEFFLQCPQCRTMYMVEEAKRPCEN